MVGTRIGGALVAVFGLAFAVFGPTYFLWLRANDLPNAWMARLGGEQAVRVNIWVFRIVGLVLAVAGVAAVIVG